MHPSHLFQGTPYLQYQRVIETYGDIHVNLSKKYLSDKLSSAKWLYSKNLVGHTGCVNALAFSSNGGEFLASGGDDRKVLIWKLCEAVAGNTKPRCLRQKHHSNIFCVTFDHDNKHIVTAGNDVAILCHDFESGELLNCYDAEANTNEICFHPESSDIFIAAESSFGQVTLFDMRTPAEQTVIAVPWPVKTTFSHWPNIPNFSSAKFNPTDTDLIATANLKNGVQLWDTRFPERCLRHFDSSFKSGREIAMCVAFDQTGRYITAVRKSHPPVLYHVDRDTSLAEFCEKGYGNTVTRKSVCFAGQKDEFVMTGSEDFNVYLWKLPKLDNDHVGIVKVNHSSLALEGHRSIVNQVIFNRATGMICSSGVEKIIKMWSPFPMAGGIAGDKVGEKRKLYTHAEYYEMLDTDWPYDEDSTSEDPQMMAMVDQWLNKPQGNILNDSESDDESPLDHVGVFVGRLRQDSLYVSEGLYDSEISQSPEGSDSTTFEDNQSFTSTGSTEKQDKVSGNAPSSEMNPENVNNSQRSTRNRNSQNSSSSEIEESEDINFHTSEGVGLERLREIISSQDRPRNSLGHIAALRRNFLRNDDEFS